MEDDAKTLQQGEIDELKKQILITRKKKAFYDKLRKRVPTTGIIISAVLLTMYLVFSYYNRHYVALLIVAIFYFLIGIIYPVTDPGKTVSLEIEALESELSLKTTESGLVEERAERLFKSHEIDLKKYYDLALKQNNSIFIVGIFCIVAGLVFIGGTIYLVYYSVLEINAKILLTILGSISGILTNFTALIYLRMFSETTKSFTTFHNKLVSTNHLHFVNFLVSKIENSDKRDTAINSICDKIAENIN